MRALITGITGQDGSYLAELLIGKGYEVVGVTRGGTPSSNLQEVADRITMVTGDITDPAFVAALIKDHAPNEVYNLASIATVIRPWEDVLGLTKITGLVPLYFLEAIKEHQPKARFFQASSAEMYGSPDTTPQNEGTPLRSRRPYGIAKTFAHQFVGAFREEYKLFATSGILFNHESPRRPDHFITRKITKSFADIANGNIESFSCGNLDAERDWGYAKEYVEAMWLMLQQDKPADYVLATGELHSVRDLIEAAASASGITITWEGEGLQEVGKDASGTVRVRIDEAFYRPLEPVAMRGDASKAREELGWEPKTSFNDLIALMTQEDNK